MKQYKIFEKDIELDDSKHYLGYRTSYTDGRDPKKCCIISDIDFDNVLSSISNPKWSKHYAFMYFKCLRKNSIQSFVDKCREDCINIKQFDEDYLKQGINNTVSFAQYFLKEFGE